MKMNNGRKQERQKEAIERQEKRNAISDKDQIKNLDLILGKGKGAKKERARLEARIGGAK